MTEAKEAAASANAARRSNAHAVLAQRLKNAEDMGVLTPKLQRQLDRVAANLMKGRK